MTNPAFLGYLNDPEGYLQEDGYLGDTGLYSWAMSVERVINRTKTVAMEVERHIVDHLAARGMETERHIVDHTKSIGMETLLSPTVYDSRGMETERFIVDHLDPRGSQTELTIHSSKALGMEVERFIQNLPRPVGMEVERFVLEIKKSTAMEVRLDHSLASWQCLELGYLEDTYLTGPYLTAGICAQQAHEVERIMFKSSDRGMEVERIIEADKTFGMEIVLRIVDRPFPIGMEVEQIKGVPFGMQVRVVLYNTKLLRILSEFPSRGTSGLNWTASSTKAGDFSANNLNTDIVEQRWQSDDGVTSVVLTCDTEVVQGIPVDTAAILEHNLTSSATIVVEGSNSPTFSPVQETFTMDPLSQTQPNWPNSYYIAPTFPTLQSRYWRFLINDPTNPAGHISIGTIVFGTTIVFQGECFVDTVVRRKKHFSDKIPTEGYTNSSNDRALKRAVALEFRKIKYGRGNYKNIIGVFDFARTSLKCLWIPDPQDPARFAVFGKLVAVPDETHNNLGSGTDADRVDFSVEVDESQ